MTMVNISSSSPHVRVKPAGPGSGLGAFAARSLDIGDAVISVEQPLVVALSTGRLDDTCYQCLRRVGDVPIEAQLGFPMQGDMSMQAKIEPVKLSRCAGCKVVKYCAEPCQKASWTAHHSLECPVFKAAQPNVLPYQIRAILRLLLLKNAGRIKPEDWEALMACPSHRDDFDRPDHSEDLGGLKEMAQMAPNFPSGSSDEDEILGLLMRLKINTLTLQTPFHDPLGLALHPLLAKLNHSCDPNCYVRFPGPDTQARPTTTRIVVTPLRPILPDEELTISYVEENQPTRHRQRELQHRYFFTCTCSKCGASDPSDHDAKTQAIRDQAKPLLDRLDKNNGTTPESTAHNIALLTASLHTLHHADHPTWPLTQYPLPALLNAMVLEHLDAGSFAAALRPACLRHFLVNPALYPSPAHPLRLTQTYVLLRILLAVLTEPTQRERAAGFGWDPEVVYRWLTKGFLKDVRRAWAGDGGGVGGEGGSVWAWMAGLIEWQGIAGEGKGWAEREKEMVKWCEGVLAEVLGGGDQRG